MRLYRDTYLDRKTGKRKKAKKWTVEFRLCGEGRRITAFGDKSASAQFGQKLERLVSLKGAGEPPTADLMQWIGQLPASTRDHLAKIGLVDSKRLAATQLLTELVSEYEQSLLAKGDTKAHVAKTVASLKRTFEGCGFKFLVDIKPEVLERYLKRQRDGSGEQRGVSVRQSNYLLGAAKSFCTWLIRMGRASEHPLLVLRPLNARVDVRRQRRALMTDEAAKLVKCTLDGPDRQGVSGKTRAMLYRLALETGLRASELASLKVLSFNLKGEAPTVTLQAAYSKHRREDVLPIRPALARALEDLLSDRLPSAMAFALPKHWRSAEMLRDDLVAAEVLKLDGNGKVLDRDENGRVLDFHALRHTFITNLARGGVSPKVAQALARHSTITLTMDRYTHLRAEDEVKALDVLPDLAPTGSD